MHNRRDCGGKEQQHRHRSKPQHGSVRRLAENRSQNSVAALAGAQRLFLGQIRYCVSSISLIATVEWAKAPPARISAATQIASMISLRVAPWRSAARVWPLMQ